MTQKSLWQPSDIMNAETGTESEAPKKRGRIPQSAWPQILERYRAGATLSAIAREFECTPSAISYIIRKAEAAGGGKEEGAGDDTPGETPVTETPVAETAAPEAAAPESADRPPVTATPAGESPVTAPKTAPRQER